MRELMRKARTAVVLVVITAVVGVGWWQMEHLKARASVNGDAGVGLTLYQGQAGVPLPQVAGKSVDGEQLDLADLRGHVVVLNVWGSWCGPCRAEAPHLAYALFLLSEACAHYRTAAEQAPRPGSAVAALRSAAGEIAETSTQSYRSTKRLDQFSGTSRLAALGCV